MSELCIKNWAAWAPGVITRTQWEEWSENPVPLTGDEKPDVKFLPPLLRRRCDLVSRMMLNVAHRCVDESELSEVACVFASTHGSLHATVSMLEELAKDEPLSPALFSHSVHNTQAGLYSIWAQNKNPSTALTSRQESFSYAFLESICQMHREQGRKILLVMGDETLPEQVAHLSEFQFGPYAVALLLAPDIDEGGVRFEMTVADEEIYDGNDYPEALEFIRFWVRNEKSFQLAHGHRRFLWNRL